MAEPASQHFGQLSELHTRYGINEPLPSYFKLRGIEEFEAWIAGIYEDDVREDLQKVSAVLNSRDCAHVSSIIKNNLEVLRDLLQRRLAALTSLQAETQEATEVLHLLLRELWARITGGSSTLSEQDTSKLQQLCTLTQHAMVGWNQVKKPGQEVKWCELFCGQMWASLPPGLGEIAAVVDFRHVEGQAQALLASRRLKEEMMQLLKDSLQTKEELPKPSSQNDHWRCQVIEIRERLKKVEYESSASKKFCERRESDMMEEHTLPMMHFKEKLVESDKKVKMLERELKKLRDEVQGFRLKNETCSMKAAAEKLELQRELLNVRKDLHEMNLKYGRLTTNGNLKMKEDVDDFKSTRHSAKDGWQESDQSCPCQADLNDGSGSWFLIQEESEISSAISATSCFSVGTGGPFCFMPDALFKTPSGQFLSGADLYKGSQILAADWTTVLQVALPPEKQAARATLLLHAQEAKLQVTPDHRVVLGNGHLVAAAELKVGDEVMVGEQVPTKLTSIEFVPGPETVLKIAFQPDMPVAVFSPPACIHSHGHKLQEIRRAGKHCRRKGRKMTVQADSWSIPDTAPGYYSD
ncbi:unnamed protein product [Durusdinium trenchii]|uniref:Hint domain-containing protein n=2 Tax=Durusdinium trenchii TaxID=1381693 RepID=A0ABP0S570_9DINO